MRMKLLFSIILMILLSLSVFAQSSSDTVSRSYVFGVDTLGKELVIDVPAGCELLYVRIKGGLDEGKCKVIVKNPKGVLEKDFQLGYNGTTSSVSNTSTGISFKIEKGKDFKTLNAVQMKSLSKDLSAASSEDLDHSTNEINGIIVHTAHRPEEGQWKVVMIPEKAVAVIEIEYSLE